ncbi:MAG: C80 family cysteine peptidase [Gammaproteobacteria bacterium]
MIIALDKDRQTNQSMGSLLALYGVDEGTRTYTDMLRAKSYNLKRAEDVTAHENPTISRITFLGHADTPNEFSLFEDANEFVVFLEKIFNETPELLSNLQTIDLFGCQVGRYQDGKNFASEVARILSEKGYILEIRAFSHRIEVTSDYGRTLLKEEAGEWSYLGLNPVQTEQYAQLKVDERAISKEINKLVALRANYNDILTDSDAEESSKDDALSQLKDLEEKIKPLLTNRQLIGNQIVELIAASEQIVPPTKEPRETLDSLDFCCFSVAPSATHSLTASVAATHDNTINSSSWEPNTIISEAKDGDGHITQQEMKDTMARLRAEGKKIQSTNDDEQQVSSIPGFSAGSDSKDK